jgi:hypothetical protein
MAELLSTWWKFVSVQQLVLHEVDLLTEVAPDILPHDLLVCLLLETYV